MKAKSTMFQLFKGLIVNTVDDWNFVDELYQNKPN